MDNSQPGDNGDPGGSNPSPPVPLEDASGDNLHVERPVLTVGRKWAVKKEDNWWCPVSRRELLGEVSFKLSDERDVKYEGTYLSGYSEDDAIQLEDVLRDVTHFQIGGENSPNFVKVYGLARKMLGRVLQIAENPTPVLESLSCSGEYKYMTTEKGALFESILDGVRSGKLKNLKALRWERNCLSDAGFAALAALIEKDCLPFLTNLSLRYNNFGPTGVTALCSALHHLGDLKLLNLGENELGSGHLCLAHAMKSGHLQALETIRLDRSGMGDADCEAYANAMCSEKLMALKEIDFGENFDIGDAGVKALVRGLKSGRVRKVERLSLLRIRITSDGVAALATAMEQGLLTRLVDLQLEHAFVSEEGIRCLARALESGKVNSLQSLTFSGLENSEDFKHLVAAFSVNTALICELHVPLTVSLRRQYELQVEHNRRMRHLFVEMGGQAVPASFGKVYLCGNPEVGKTTLRKSLQRSYVKSLYTWETKSHVEPRTRGIEICKMMNKGGPGENEVTLTLWDMAGQDDYHLVHNSFLPGLVHGEGKATMFVVMCTSRNISSAEDELQSWFKFIASSVDQTMGHRRDVFVVVNRWDGDNVVVDSAHVWQSMLSMFSQKFEKQLNIKPDPLIVDVRKRKTTECIKKALFKQIREMLKTEYVPEICQIIQSNIHDWGNNKEGFPVLEWSEFVSEIERKDANWSEKALEAAVKYLDEAGELIYVQKESIEENLIILYPIWFCNHVMGNMFLAEGMGVQAEQLFRKNVDSHTGSISIKDFTAFFESLKGPWQSSRFDDLITILLWGGFCYNGRNENIFIPSLIKKGQTVDHLWDFESKSGDRRGQWVMGYQVDYAQNELALAPIALWHKFQVELAQTVRFNGRPDNDFVVGKYFIYFKVDYMVVRIKTNADEEHPTFNRIQVLVKPFLSNETGDLDLNTRKQCQLDLARDIVEILLVKWKHVCPGIDSVQRVVWPWPVSRPRPEIEEKQNLEVDEVKRRVQESGVVRFMQWHVGDDDTVTEEQLLCTKDKEVVFRSLRQSIYDVHTGVREAIRMQIISPKDEVNEAWIPNSVEDEVSSTGGWTSTSMEKKTIEDTYKTSKGNQHFDEPSLSLQQPQRDDELHGKLDKVLAGNEKILAIAKETLSGIRQVDARLSQVMHTHKALRGKVEDIGRTFLQDREQTCPKFVYVGKRNSGVWMCLKDVISSTVKVKVRVYFACEANCNADGPHEVNNQEGIDVSELKDWARTILPLVKVSLTILLIAAKVSANVVAPGTGLVVDNFMQWQQASSLAESIYLATGFSAEKLDELASSDLHASKGSTLKDMQELYGTSRKTMTQILARLTPQEFEQQVGLWKVCLKHNDGSLRGVVWVCNDCFASYRKSNRISEL